MVSHSYAFCFLYLYMLYKVYTISDLYEDNSLQLIQAKLIGINPVFKFSSFIQYSFFALCRWHLNYMEC